MQCEPSRVVRGEQHKTATLPARTGTLAYQSLISLATARPWPCLVTIAARQPVNVRLEWSLDGAGPSVTFAVARGTQVCIVAQQLTIEVANRAAVDNPVLLNVAPVPNFVQTQNHAIEVYDDPQASTDLVIDPFVRSARVEVADPAGTATILCIDPRGNTVGAYDLGNQPEDGIPTAGLSALRLTTSHACRVVQALTL